MCPSIMLYYVFDHSFFIIACTKKVQQEKLAALSLLGDDLFISEFPKV